MSRKSFVNTPAARMLAGSAVVENKIPEETKPVIKEAETMAVIEQKETNSIKETSQENLISKEKEVEVKVDDDKKEIKEKEPMTKVLIEMSLLDAYKINNIVNALKLKNKGKYTKKQFYAEMIEAAIVKFEKELGL